MTSVKYQMRVVEIGPLVPEFLEARILVFFKVGAPPELAEFSILHEPSDSFSDVETGDHIVIGEEDYQVTAIGEVANNNIRDLGHLVMKANGRNEPELPGDVCVEDKELPPVHIGTVISILAAKASD
jgi:PTS system glucitol/sorbitol-specific IIA component